MAQTDSWVSLLSGGAQVVEEDRRDLFGVVVGTDGLARPAWAERGPELRDYYDTEWGIPIFDDLGMFRALSLLVLQGGMRWGAAIVRAAEMGEALDGFDYARVARYGPADMERLLNDRRVIRNRRKLSAVVTNAQAVTRMGEGEFTALVWSHRPERSPVVHSGRDVPRQCAESEALAGALRGRGFTFVGPRVCYSLFQCAGVVDTNPVGTHRRGASGLWSADGQWRGRPVPGERPAPLSEGAQDGGG